MIVWMNSSFWPVHAWYNFCHKTKFSKTKVFNRHCLHASVQHNIWMNAQKHACAHIIQHERLFIGTNKHRYTYTYMYNTHVYRQIFPQSIDQSSRHSSKSFLLEFPTNHQHPISFIQVLKTWQRNASVQAIQLLENKHFWVRFPFSFHSFSASSWVEGNSKHKSDAASEETQTRMKDTAVITRVPKRRSLRVRLSLSIAAPTKALRYHDTLTPWMSFPLQYK